MKEKKDNTGLIVVIVVSLLLVIGVVAYMLFMSDDKDTNTITDEVQEETSKITMNDVAGSYYGTFEISDKSLAEDAADEIADAADDVKDAVTGDDNDDNDNNNDAYRIELVLNSNGNAKMVNTEQSDEVIEGKYTLNDNTITFTSDDNDEVTLNFNTDDTITYSYKDTTITLTKTNNSSLEYIK